MGWSKSEDIKEEMQAAGFQWLSQAQQRGKLVSYSWNHSVLVGRCESSSFPIICVLTAIAFICLGFPHLWLKWSQLRLKFPFHCRFHRTSFLKKETSRRIFVCIDRKSCCHNCECVKSPFYSLVAELSSTDRISLRFLYWFSIPFYFIYLNLIPDFPWVLCMSCKPFIFTFHLLRL